MGLTFVSIFAGLIAAVLLLAARPKRAAAKVADGLRRNEFFRDAGEIGRSAGSPGKLELNAASVFAVCLSAMSASGGGSLAVKRVIDVIASLGLMITTAPALLVVAMLIKIDSPGPIFYRQKRVGYGAREFDVFKFRSMTADAEKDGPQYARADDERVTRVGRFIRKTRIDEIPQTINVLRGEMSLVGPRPERPEFVAELEREIANYHLRHIVKPGITGWAQVKYEYAASVEGAREKLRYDLYYIRHFTPLLDIWIILKTMRVVLFGLGSR